MKKFAVLVWGLSMLAGVSVGANADGQIDISAFEQGLEANWEGHSFEGETQYQIEQEQGLSFLRAKSNASASGLVRKIEVDLEKTPILSWRWRVNQGLDALPETEKKGDDYAARLYLVVDGGFFFWKTKALNLVWSSRDVTDEHWPNAFAPDNARMIALRGANDPSGQWLEERIDVAALLTAWLGKDATKIDAVAIMTDTDNSGLQAQADYADIRFSAN